MNQPISVFPTGTIEHAKLQDFADRLNKDSGHIEYRVEETYFDFGQGWKWTTLIAHDKNKDPSSVLSSWQALNPAQQGKILFGTDDDANAVFSDIMTELDR